MFLWQNKSTYLPTYLTCKNIFACLLCVHNMISLSCHEQVCLLRIPYISKCSLIEHTCS